MTTVKLKSEGKYVDHSVKANKALTLQFKMPYAELTNYIQSIQMLNENVTVAVKIGADKKPLILGTFMVHNLNIDRDGEGKIKFNSLLEHINANHVNTLAERNDEPLHILLKADIDVDDDDDEDLPDDDE